MPNWKLDTNRIYKEASSFLKEDCESSLWVAKGIPISGPQEELLGYLLPFSEKHRDHEETISRLSSWRDAHQYAYPGRFKITDVGTKTWLAKAVLENSDRILFLLTDIHFKPMGHIGLLKVEEEPFKLEVDNVLRGETGVSGLMTFAMNTLEKWAELEFSIEQITLRVLKSNTRAVNFYNKLGYSIISEESLVEKASEGRIDLIPGSPGTDAFLTMSKSLLDGNAVPELILTAGSSIGAQGRSYALDAAAYGWNSRHSDYLNTFEKEFAEYVGSEFAMATSSCTGALHLALAAAGIGPGDEVIVPEITWVATASAIRYVGATPIFAEIDPYSWTLDPEKITDLITPKTKAILPVHLYGFAAQMSQIMQIANDHNLLVIEDAAPAIGATVDGQTVGTFGNFGCYSFQGAKMLVTGEGGMLVTNDPELAFRAKTLQEHGRKPGTFWIQELGRKYKMSNIQAALGLGQIQRSDNQIFRKRRIREWYEEELSDTKGIRFQREESNTNSIHWMTSIMLENADVNRRDEVIKLLRESGIDSRPVFPAMSQFPIWDRPIEPPKQISALVGDTSINLPSGVHLSRQSIEKIGKVVREIIM